ncbi:MAG: hypothetical protein IJ558_09495 [Treponema sp.]|nr:hypothetical protein [Treponema sp.]
MNKIAIVLISLFFTSCAAFFNEKIDAADNLSDCFHTKINGVEVISFSPDDDITLTADSTDTDIKLSLTSGFISYSWAIDGKVIAGNENEISIAFDGLEIGWHLVTVIARDADGNYYSAAAYFQTVGEKTPSGTSVATSFAGTDAESISLSSVTENAVATFTATAGFASYAWTLDGAALTESSSAACVNLLPLAAGIHIVTVIAKNAAGIYYSASAQITKSASLEPEIKCTGITVAFASGGTEPFSVTSVAGSMSVTLTATSGFASYAWMLDGTAVASSTNTATVSLASLAAGWHLVTVTAYTSGGACYSATIQVQKTGAAGSMTVQAGAIRISFAESASALSVATETSGTTVAVIATSGFTSYAWTLDGISLTGSANTASVTLASLELGWHLITVTAGKDGMYYSASTYIQKKGA